MRKRDDDRGAGRELWTAEHAHSTGTTEQFIDLAQRISG